MNFKFSNNQYFRIGETTLYQTQMMSFSVKECDFIYLNKNTLFFIEAKQSFPQGSDDFNTNVEAISEKFIHSLFFYLGLYSGRYNTKDVITNKIAHSDISNMALNLVLVIRGHNPKWLPPIQDAFQQKLKPVSKLLKIHNVLVINDKIARQYKWIK